MTRDGLRALVILLLLLLVLAGSVASFARLKTDLSFVMPRNPSPDVELLAERLQHGPAASLILISLSGAAPEALAKLSNDLAKILAGSSAFHFVTNGRLDPERPELAFLFRHRYLLNPPIAAEDFSAAALRSHLETALGDLGSALGPASKQALPADPTGRTQAMARFWSAGSLRSAGGVWLSADQSKAFLLLWSKAPAFDLDRQEAVLALVRESFEQARGTQDGRMALTGPSVFAAAAKAVIHDDMQRLSAISLVAVLAMLIAAFRSLSLLLALGLPLGFGVVAATAAVQLLFGEVHGITLAFGATLVGVVVDYPIHLVSHGAGEATPWAGIGKVWRTLRLGMLTTVAAFLPFTLSSFPGLSQLGLFAIVGLATAALVSRYALPPVLGAQTAPLPGAAWIRLEAMTPRLVYLRWPLVGLAVAGLLYLGLREATIWETDLRNLSPTPAATRDLDRELRREMGAADVRYLLVLRGDTAEAVLRASEALWPELDALAARGVMAGYDMAARYLPSAASQAGRRTALPEAPALAAALRDATRDLPFQDGLFGPFLADVARSKAQDDLDLADFQEAGLSWRLDPLIFRQDGSWVGLIVPNGVQDPSVLIDFVAQRGDLALSYLDLKQGSESLVADYRREAMLWLALGAMVALTILVVGQRSLGGALRVVAPVLVSLALTATVLTLAGTAYSLFHLMSFLLVVGVGLDYALFFDRNAAARADRLNTLRANVLCAGTSATVFAILATSQVPVLQGIGATVAVGGAISLVAAAVFARPADLKGQ